MGTQGTSTQADDGKARMLRFVSRCTSVDELVDTFANLIDETTLFICTKNVFDVGLRRRFSVTLRNGTPVLRGEAEVQESPARLSGPTSPIGIRLKLLKLTPDSLQLRERLLERKREKEVTQVDPLPLPPVPMPPVRTISPRKGRSGRFQTTPGAGPVLPPGERISGIMAAVSAETTTPTETPSEVIRADSVPNKVESVQVKIESVPVRAELSDPHIPVKQPHEPEVSGRTLTALARALERGGAPAPPVVPPAAAAAALASAVSLKSSSSVPVPLPPAKGRIPEPPPPALEASGETTQPEATAERVTTAKSPLPDPTGDDDAEMEADALTMPRSPSVAGATSLLAPEERAPSSDIILPANPLSEISDRSLEAMIEVVIYEDDLPPRDETFDNLLTPRPGSITVPPAVANPLADGASNGASGDRADLGVLGALGPRARTATAGPFPEEHKGGGALRLVLSLLAIALGFACGYLVFGTDLLKRGGGRDQPAATPAGGAADPAAAPAEPPAGDKAAPATDPSATPAATADNPAAAAATCTAAIDTSPATARVLLDGAEVGVGSLEDVKVPCDREFTLKVEHAGYKTFERHFTAATGVPLRIDAALTRQEPVVTKKSKLRIVSQPEGAILTVDGKVVGRGSASVTVDTGNTVFVTATLKGHKGWSKKVYVKKKTQTVSAELEPIE